MTNENREAGQDAAIAGQSGMMAGEAAGMASGAVAGGVTGWSIGMVEGALVGLVAGVFLGLTIASHSLAAATSVKQD